MRMFLAAALALAALAGPAQAASVRPLTLDQLIDQSTTVIEATAVANRSERDEKTGYIVTYTTFAVKDVLKGTAEKTHVIKQIGGVLLAEGMGFKVSGIPKFTEGQDYVVFLAGVSTIGFSSPIGLGQGSFRVDRDTQGMAKVSNGRDFRSMTAGTDNLVMPPVMAKSLATATVPVNQMALDDFKSLVRSHLGRAK
jgi:hypothetical protein